MEQIRNLHTSIHKKQSLCKFPLLCRRQSFGELWLIPDTMDKTPPRRTRKQPRILCNLLVTINDVLVCTAFDVSEGGLYVNTSQGLSQGLVVTVSMEHGGERVAVKARVKHVEEGIGTGLMFIDLDDVVKKKINKMIAEVQGSSG